MSLRIPVRRTRTPKYKYEAVDIRLHDGLIIENLTIDYSGLILGKVVGGHAGLDEAPLPFKQQDIEAYRFRVGLVARLGLAKWRKI